MVDTLRAPDESTDVVYGIIRVLSMIESQGSVDVLFEYADQEDLELRFEAIKALSKLGTDFSSLRFDAKRVETLIIEEVKDCYNLLVALHQHQIAGDDTDIDCTRSEEIRSARNLLQRAIQERIDKNLERIFLLLGLRYPPDDIHNAYQGIVSRKPDLQANAIEFLDNLLDHPLKRYILPTVEQNLKDGLVPDVSSPVDVTVLLRTDYFARLLKGPDNWLKTCSLLLIAQLRESKWLDEAIAHTHSHVPILRETAEYAVHRLRTS